MARFWVIAILCLVQAAAGFTFAGGAKGKTKEKPFIFKGNFTKDDPRDPQRGGPSQIHVVKLKAGKSYTIDMESNQVDSYLRLLDPKDKVLAEDDDSGGMLNSRITFSCTMDGDYKLVATTFGANAQGGAYTLTAKLTGAVQAPSNAHTKMIGKPAPDFQSDFAVNGKPASLSDLKGKIVVLYFWEVRSSPSVAMLPRLNEWSKAYKDKGVAVVGVTFYTSEIGQHVGLDKKTGAVVTVPKADRVSDQTLWRAFAAYHKVDHLVLALPKKNALATFDTYAVNSLPQIVVIDRQGVVRMIEIGGERNSSAVETMLKKLMEEK